jgi:hypothetical protein
LRQALHLELFFSPVPCGTNLYRDALAETGDENHVAKTKLCGRAAQNDSWFVPQEDQTFGSEILAAVGKN